MKTFRTVYSEFSHLCKLPNHDENMQHYILTNFQVCLYADGFKGPTTRKVPSCGQSTFFIM